MTVAWNGEEYLRVVVLPSLEEGLDIAALAIRTEIKQLLGGPRGSAPGQPPGQRMGESGGLRSRINWVNAGNLKRQIGTDLRYGAFLERGGVIRARGGKYLTIPVSKEAETLRRRNRTLRSIPNLFVIKAKSGNLLLCRSKTKGKGKSKGQLEILFVLKKLVMIRARPFLIPGLTQGLPVAQKHFARVAQQGMANRRLA